MKKLFLIASMVIGVLIVSCDPNSKSVQEEDTTSNEVLEGENTPSQYEGSTGVSDKENNNMEANENIQLKKQEFKGSFASAKTQNYELTVIETDEYTFRLESDNPNVRYLINNQNGDEVVEQTADSKTVTLEPGEYVINATLDAKEGEEVDAETEFTVYIE